MEKKLASVVSQFSRLTQQSVQVGIVRLMYIHTQISLKYL